MNKAKECRGQIRKSNDEIRKKSENDGFENWLRIHFEIRFEFARFCFEFRHSPFEFFATAQLPQKSNQ